MPRDIAHIQKSRREEERPSVRRFYLGLTLFTTYLVYGQRDSNLHWSYQHAYSSLRVSGKDTYRLVNVLIIYTVNLPIESMGPTVQRLSSPPFLALDRVAFHFIQYLVLLGMNTLCPR